jgi:hypothetical protein
MITEKQRARIFAIANSRGWSIEQLKQLLWMRFKTEKTDGLTLPNYEWLCQMLERTKPKDYGIKEN